MVRGLCSGCFQAVYEDLGRFAFSVSSREFSQKVFRELRVGGSMVERQVLLAVQIGITLAIRSIRWSKALSSS